MFVNSRKIHAALGCLVLWLLMFCDGSTASAAATLQWTVATDVYPSKVAVDNAGNSYVVNNNSNTLIKYNSAGSRLWTAATDHQPATVAVDPAGTYIYVGTAYGTAPSRNLEKFNSAGGRIWTVPLAADPRDVAVDPWSNPYVVTTGTTYSYSAAGGFWWSAPAGGYSGDIDGAGNWVYAVNSGVGVADVAKIMATNGTIVWTCRTSSPSSFQYLFGAPSDSAGNVYAVNAMTNLLYKINSAGSVAWSVATGSGPWAVTVDSAGNIYVVNRTGNTLQKFNTSGTLLWSMAVNANPYDVIVDNAMNIYVISYPANTLQKFSQGCSGPVSISWTDPTITANGTPIRKAHIDELRSWVNARRVDAGLSGCTYTDNLVTANSTPVRKINVDELRTCISQVYTACGQAAPAFTDPTITAGSTAIRKVHIDELRSATANAP